MHTSAYNFTNHFSQSDLRSRIRMMNRPDSKRWSAWRYGILWLVLILLFTLACRHKGSKNNFEVVGGHAIAAINPTRALVVQLEDEGSWYQHLALLRKKNDLSLWRSDPIMVLIKGNQIAIADDYKTQTTIYINGKVATEASLRRLSPEYVEELFVMRKWEGSSEEFDPKPYRVLVQTSSKPLRFTAKRNHFFTLLQASALSQHPFGESHSFTMNQLLEATFFHNKNALVERTENEHLKVYDEFVKHVDIFINNKPVTSKEVTTVHVREVARLYTEERSYVDWFRADQPQPRYVLNIQTAPERAKRDSSYYVFSPFYSGDF